MKKKNEILDKKRWVEDEKAIIRDLNTRESRRLSLDHIVAVIPHQMIASLHWLRSKQEEEEQEEEIQTN